MLNDYYEYLLTEMQNTDWHTIQRTEVKGDWFLYDVEETSEGTQIVTWTKNQRSCIKFQSEEDAGQTYDQLIVPRDADIVRVDKRFHPVK